MPGTEWPAHFPAGCPAGENPDPVNGAVFHLLRRQRSQDYKTAFERNAFPDGPPCRRVAFSCYVNLQAAQHHLDIQPTLFRAIARADLTPAHGAIKHTPTSQFREHHSLWLRARYDARDLFTEVRIGGEA